MLYDVATLYPPHFNVEIMSCACWVGTTDVGRDVRVLPAVFPVEETAVILMSLPVVVETGPQVGCEPDLLLSEQDVEVDIADIRHDIRNLPDMLQVRFDKMAAVPMTLPVDVEMVPSLRLKCKLSGDAPQSS